MHRYGSIALLLCACYAENPGWPPQVLVPGGQVRAFYLDVAPVTVRAYRACVVDLGCMRPMAQAPGNFCNWTEEIRDKEDHPINCVDWEQARDFCSRWRGRRLPTEEERAYAQGANISKYAWGNGPEPEVDGQKAQLCWARETLGTCKVGTYRRTLLGMWNDNGAADLAGNVYEWTSSDCGPNLKCQRGCSWKYRDPADALANHPVSDTPTDKFDDFGFRCASDAD